MMRCVLLAAFLVLMLAGCGGNVGSVSCDEGPYLAAVSAPKVKAPDGLDDLDPLAEMPMPEASPQEPRPDDGRCLEQPPTIIRME